MHFPYLFLQEMGDPSPLLFSNCGKHLVGHSKVPPHYGSLVLQDGDQQGVAHDVELFVSKVQTVVFGYVTQQVHGPAGRESSWRERFSILHSTQIHFYTLEVVVSTQCMQS